MRGRIRMTNAEKLAARLARSRQLSGVRVEAMKFAAVLGQPLWISTYTCIEERPAGSPLAPGEEIFAEGGEQGQMVWLVSRQDGNRALNPAFYSRTRLELSCVAGPATALSALSEFMNASWFHALDDPSFLTALLAMTPDSGVNLRDEGQAVRESGGEWVQIWAGESYFDGPAQTHIRMSELSEITALCLKFWHLRQHFKQAQIERAQQTPTHAAERPTHEKLTIDEELPRYEAKRGFVNAECWE